MTTDWLVSAGSWRRGNAIMLERTPPATPVRDLALRVRRRWCAARAGARDRNLLAGMDARELRDIGVTVTERDFELGRPWWRAMFASRLSKRARLGLE